MTSERRASWSGSLLFDPPQRPPKWQKGDRIDHGPLGVWVVDEVSEPDEHGVTRATVHLQGDRR